MQRFFVGEKQIDLQMNSIFIIGEDVNHIKNVLRCKINEQIEVCNKDNCKAYLCEIKDISEAEIKCFIKHEIEVEKESNIHINIIQGLPKSEKMELIIQKCTELGVKEITPIRLRRCVVKIDKKDETKKIDRWRKQAESAAKQCGRNMIPIVNNIQSIDTLYNIIKDYDLVIVAYENEKENSLRKELDNIKKENAKIAIVVGPEGGLEEGEVDKLEQNGAKIVSLGSRILRTETVALVVTAILMYELGDFG